MDPQGNSPGILHDWCGLKAPHTPRHSSATDRRDGQIGRIRQLRGEQTAKFRGRTTGPGNAPDQRKTSI